MLAALEYMYRRPDLIVECEHVLSRALGNSEEDLWVISLLRVYVVFVLTIIQKSFFQPRFTSLFNSP